VFVELIFWKNQFVTRITAERQLPRFQDPPLFC